MIREIEEQDAAAFLELCRLLDGQTSFMLLEPDKRQTTVEEQIQRIRDARAGQREKVWIAEVEGKLVGFLGATVGGVKRNRHSANLAMGVLSDYWGRSIGQGLLEALEVWARSLALRRLALTVMTHNAAPCGSTSSAASSWKDCDETLCESMAASSTSTRWRNC
jgi:RimJ/RimL family protein N-acetyltransferase